jgi:hypothetical protein
MSSSVKHWKFAFGVMENAPYLAGEVCIGIWPTSTMLNEEDPAGWNSYLFTPTSTFVVFGGDMGRYEVTEDDSPLEERLGKIKIEKKCNRMEFKVKLLDEEKHSEKLEQWDRAYPKHRRGEGTLSELNHWNQLWKSWTDSGQDFDTWSRRLESKRRKRQRRKERDHESKKNTPSDQS